MTQIPTAKAHFFLLYSGKDEIEALSSSAQEWLQQKAIEFAKLHVQAALEAAFENVEIIDGWNTGFSGSAASLNKDSIINAYPLVNIK
jgi:hypothetical protein